jgi:hypothetical protein
LTSSSAGEVPAEVSGGGRSTSLTETVIASKSL